MLVTLISAIIEGLLFALPDFIYALYWTKNRSDLMPMIEKSKGEN